MKKTMFTLATALLLAPAFGHAWISPDGYLDGNRAGVGSFYRVCDHRPCDPLGQQSSEESAKQSVIYALQKHCAKQGLQLNLKKTFISCSTRQGRLFGYVMCDSTIQAAACEAVQP